MNTRQLINSMSLAVLFIVTALMGLTGKILAADLAAPSSLVGHRFALSDVAGGQSVMQFPTATRYFLDKTSQNTNEAGFYTATRSGSSIWNVATTRDDGRVTTQFTFDFSTGIAVAAQAGRSRTTNTFQEATIPSSGLLSVKIQNEVSITGPSFYTINFSGGTAGNFKIELPGYGSGTYHFTPNTNAAKLFLTYTNADLIGDTDDLTLEFRATSGSTNASRQFGSNRVSRVTYPAQGTFTYTSVP